MSDIFTLYDVGDPSVIIFSVIISPAIVLVEDDKTVHIILCSLITFYWHLIEEGKTRLSYDIWNNNNV